MSDVVYIFASRKRAGLHVSVLWMHMLYVLMSNIGLVSVQLRCRTAHPMLRDKLVLPHPPIYFAAMVLNLGE